MPARNTIEIVINATDNASRVFNSLTDNTQSLGKTFTTALVGGLAVATTAIAGFAVRGIQEFTDFQQGITEVFTLIPDASEQMKKKLTDDVQYLADRFGILAKDQIPAVYQALSAGVPPDNIFDFLTTANKAAVGGVVNLESAVDGITSVLNAYGLSADKASQVSDVMFTGIRLGKTTFDELSASLFQVIPSASALGVSFGDVTAALASITSQGTPTSVATTQLRQLFVELSKAGGKAADTFQQLSGKSFRDFIASGGNVQDALKIMEQGAQASGLSISDMFSSVEAGNAALQLTGKGAARFTDFLGQMNNAAGATDKAFTTMSDTLQFQFNRTLAKINNLFIEIGSKIEPALKPVVEAIGNIIGWFTDLIAGGTSVEDFISYDLPQAFRPLATVILNVVKEFKRVSDIIGRFFNGITHGVPFLLNLKAVMYSLFPKDTADAINVIVDGLNNLWKIIKPIADAIIKWVTDNVELKDVLLAIGVAISSFVIPAIIGIVTAITPVIATFATLVIGVSLLRKAWEKNFLGIRDIAQKVIDFIKNIPNAVGNIVANLKQRFHDDLQGLDIFENIQFVTADILNKLFGFDKSKVGIWIDTNLSIPLRKAINTIKDLFSGKTSIGDLIKSSIEKIKGNAVIGKLLDMFTRFKNAVMPLFESIGKALSKIFEHLDINQIVKIGSTLLSLTSPLGIIKLLFEKITGIDVFGALIDGIEVFTNLINNLSNGVPLLKALGIEDDSTIATIINTITDVISGLVDYVLNVAIPGLMNFGKWFLTDGLPAIIDFVANVALPAIQSFFSWLGSVWEQVKPALEALGSWFINDALPAIVSFITNIVIPGVQKFIDILSGIWAIVAPFLGDLLNWFITDGLPAIVKFISETVIPGVQKFIDILVKFWDDIQPGLDSFFKWVTTDALPAVVDFLNNVIVPAIQTFIDILVGIWDLVSPVLTELFNWFMENGLPLISDFITNGITPVLSGLIDLIKGIWNAVQPGLNSFKNGIKTIFDWVKTNVIDPIIARINEFVQTLTNLGIIQGNTQATVNAAVANAATNPSSAVTDPQHLFGQANGLAYASRDMPIKIHQGERVLTKDENKAYTNNQGTKPSIVIENINFNDVKDQNDANIKAGMFVRGLRAQGVEI